MLMILCLFPLGNSREEGRQRIHILPPQQATSTVQGGSSVITFTICLVPIMQLVVDDGVYVLIFFLVTLWVGD